MRFYHSLTLSTLILIYLLSDNVLGSPTKGKYTWLKCNPDGKDANCVQKEGPLIDLPGPPQRLPSRVVREMDRVLSSEESAEPEDSGDGSGDLSPDSSESFRKKRNSGPEWIRQGRTEEEGSGFEVDYFNFEAPEAVKPKLSAEDLREENMIE